MSKQYLTWVDIEQAVDHFAKIYQKYDITHVVGINRGGLIPAVMLSHKLNVPHVPITISLRHSDILIVDISDRAKDIFDDERNVIAVVDDINDSGATFDNLYNKIEICATIYDMAIISKQSSQWTCDAFWIKPDSDEQWWVFPYE